MNQTILVNNYSTYKQANGIDTTNSSVSPELAKDRGSEKCTRNINNSDDPGTPMPTSYQTETVDFPDSPQYQQFNKGFFQETKVPNSGGEMDTTAGASSCSNGDHSLQGSLRHIPYSSEGITLVDSFSSDKEEYFEDDLVTGKLDSAFSISDEDMLSSDDDSDGVFSADQLELVAKQVLHKSTSSSEQSLTENSLNSLRNSHETPKSLDSSQKTNDVGRIITPSARDSRNGYEHNQNEGFLFDEKASEDAPDTSLVQKVRLCFDKDKIKDIYMLSGRLQDILTPNEIEEIVTHSEIYSEFFDDDVIEMLSAARLEKINNYEGVEKFQTISPVQNNRKVIPALRNKLNVDVIDDIKYRAVFEGHKKSGEEAVATSSFLGSKHQSQSLKVNTTSPTGDNIRAFFEESLVKSSSTLKKITPENDTLSLDVSSDLYHDNALDNSSTAAKQPQTGILLSVHNLESSSVAQHNFTPVLKPDGTIELIDGKNKPNTLEKDRAVCSVDTVNNERLMEELVECAEKERPASLNSAGNIRRKKKISVNRDILASEEHDDQRSLSSLSNKSDTDVFSPADDLVTPEDIETPDDLDESMLEGARSSASEPIPEVSAQEELDEERSWKTCLVGGVKRKIDMKVIEPYKKVLSHGGYFGETRNAIIVFSACYLPDRSRRDYDYVMDNLFLYVLITLDQLVAEDYVLVYLHGATQRSNMPSFGWLKRCYQMIDRRLRKNLKGLYLVHPTFWLKTIVIMTRPFVSSKFSRKLQFVNSLDELSELIPMDHVCIPSKVKEFDVAHLLEA